MQAVKMLLAQDAFLHEIQGAMKFDGAFVKGKNLAAQLMQPTGNKGIV